MYYPSSILQDGGWKHPACHLSHVIFHLDPKLLDVRVQVEVSILHLWRVKDMHHISQKSQSHTLLCSLHPAVFSTTHQPADLLLPVGGRASCGFDHSGGLIICKLLDASLTSYNVTYLKRENTESSGCRHQSDKLWVHLKMNSVILDFFLTSRGR